ncbi:hypothetical protein V2J09_005702 [Rumex salicifolius]
MDYFKWVEYTFSLACKIFLSLEDSNHIAQFADPFDHLASGTITLPVNLPGTPFNRAIKASKFIRKELKEVIKQRTLDLAVNKATPTQDILSHMLTTAIEGESGQERFMGVATTPQVPPLHSLSSIEPNFPMFMNLSTKVRAN